MADDTRSPDAEYLKSLMGISSIFISGVLVFGAMAGFLITSLTADNIDAQVVSIIALCIQASLSLFGSFTFASLSIAMLETSAVFSKYEDTRANRNASRAVFLFSIFSILMALALFFFLFL